MSRICATLALLLGFCMARAESASAAEFHTNVLYGIRLPILPSAVVCRIEPPAGNHEVVVLFGKDADCARLDDRNIVMTLSAYYNQSELEDDTPPRRRTIARKACVPRGASRIVGFRSVAAVAGLPTFECRREWRAESGEVETTISLYFYRGRWPSNNPRAQPYPKIDYTLWISGPADRTAEAERILREVARGIRLLPL